MARLGIKNIIKVKIGEIFSQLGIIMDYIL